MAPSDETLAKLTATSPRHLLDELARIGAALAPLDRARPEVEVFLGSGQVIRGRIVSVADERGGAMVLLHTAGSPRTPSVAYIRVDQIAAVTVGDASVLVHAPTSDAPVPSRLELARHMALRGDAIASAWGRPTALTLAGTADDDARRAIGLALPLVAEVLIRIGDDEMGKEAVAKVAAIEIEAGRSLGASLEDHGALRVTVPTVVTEPLTRARLRAAIEALL